MSIKAVFFDLDGTLLDTAPDFVVTLNQLADEYQIAPVSPERIRQTVSDGARALTTLLFGLQEDEPGYDERKQRLLEIYRQHMGKHCVLFDGMIELLTKLRVHNLAWGIITNKPVRFAEPIVRALPLPEAPALLLCPEHVKHSKPHPEPLLSACRQVDCEPDEAIYIGDHHRDIECGIRAGSETVVAAFGYLHDNDTIRGWNAHYRVNHASEIWPIVQSKINY